MERLSLKDIKDPRDKIITDLELKINSLKEQLEKEREELSLANKTMGLIQHQRDVAQEQLEKERENLKEAYTDGFSDSRFDFDIENYTQNQSKYE